VITTVKVPIQIPEDRREDIFKTFEIVQDIFNIHTDWSWKNQTYNKHKAHVDLYRDIRNKYPELPSQYIQSTRDQALESTKRAFNKIKRLSKIKNNKTIIQKPRKKQFSSFRIDRCSGTFNSNTGLFGFSCIGKRIKIEVPKPDYFKTVMETGFFQAATIHYNKRENRFWLSLNFKLPDPEVKVITPDKVVGIDLGIYNICTLSDGSMIPHNKVRSVKRKRQYLRSKLQTKGTPSSKRKLKILSGKEARFSRNENHVLSKHLVQSDYDVFVFENLKNIRKSHKKYHKKSNRMISNWSYGQLIEFTTYKAQVVGKHVFKVSPAFTSQRCSSCGTIEKTNRQKSKYKCSCGHEMHADVNAARNIRNIFLSTLF
jgi:putative transposase